MTNDIVIVGEKKMSEYIWHWRIGSSKIYTRKEEVAEKAMREGLSVIGIKAKSNIIKY